MNFERFAELHGLIISSLIMDRWVRVPTTDHPHSRNGAYIFHGDTGCVQNWAIHEKPVSWKSPKPFLVNNIERNAKNSWYDLGEYSFEGNLEAGLAVA